MQRRFWILLVVASALAPFVAFAQSPQLMLLPNQRAEFRFDYNGDGSPITIALDSPGMTGVTLSIYTPEQLDKIFRGETLNPVGRGTPQKNYILYWTGAFNRGGTYRIVIENKTGNTYPYRLDVTGDSVKSFAPINAGPAAAPTSFVANDGKLRVLNVPLPPGSGAASLRLAVPEVPTTCTHANQIPQPIRASVRLCANETYPPLKVSGNNIVVMGDESRTSIVTSTGRQFALTVDGSSNWIEGISVQANADGLDRVAWVCLYDSCVFNTSPQTTVKGGLLYGGGILVNGSNSVVRGVAVRGAMIGIASNGGRGNYFLENQVSDSFGWGMFHVKSADSFFVNNEWSRVNHGCTTPDGTKLDHGCETAGWVCLACSGNLIAQNQCAGSANCYYMSGERGLASNNNRFVANYCAASPDNCFEITFARDNTFQDNTSTVDPKTGQTCKYPFWVGGSTVYFKNNHWECDYPAEKALDDARNSTTTPTNILDLDVFVPPTPPLLPSPTRGGAGGEAVPTQRAAPAPSATSARPRNPCAPNDLNYWLAPSETMPSVTCW